MKFPLSVLLAAASALLCANASAQIVPPPNSDFCDAGPQRAHVTYEYTAPKVPVAFAYIELSCTPESFDTSAGLLKLQSGMSRYVAGNAILLTIILLKS